MVEIKRKEKSQFQSVSDIPTDSVFFAVQKKAVKALLVPLLSISLLDVSVKHPSFKRFIMLTHRVFLESKLYKAFGRILLGYIHFSPSTRASLFFGVCTKRIPSHFQSKNVTFFFTFFWFLKIFEKTQYEPSFEQIMISSGLFFTGSILWFTYFLRIFLRIFL